MKRLFTTVLIITATVTGLRAQDLGVELLTAAPKTAAELQQAEATPKWTSKGVAGLNLSQASFSNWAAGGDPAIAFDALFNYSLDYKYDRHLWTNRLELAYGLSNTKSNGTRKTNDKIYFSSNYGYRIAPSLYVGGILTFNTQFDKGFDYTVTPYNYISDLMSPGYLSMGAGLTWLAKPWLTVIYSPVSWRGTFVTSDILSAQGAYGVDPGKHFRNEIGSNLRAEVNTPLWKIFSLYSRLDLYANYLAKPQNVDVNWEVQITMKATNWLSVNVHTNLLYDDDSRFAREDGSVGPSLQFKEVLGVGLQFNF